MTEKSLLDNTNSTDNIEYINECVREVCINGDALSKYEKMIGKLFPDDPGFYAKVTTFVDKCKEMANKPNPSATSIENIKYLASEIHVTEKTVDEILKAKKSLNKKNNRTRHLTTLWSYVKFILSFAVIGFIGRFFFDEGPDVLMGFVNCLSCDGLNDAVGHLDYCENEYGILSSALVCAFIGGFFGFLFKLALAIIQKIKNR